MSTSTNGTSVTTEQAPPELFNARNVVTILEQLMVRVTAEDCSASTVNAACNAAARIVDVLRLHLDAQRLQIQQRRLSAGQKE